ncbi:MAG: hypothetical protein GY845_22370 [Planctomycetes bacterium]|nr:hypothetical protein [Planctomycetota bacterium]
MPSQPPRASVEDKTESVEEETTDQEPRAISEDVQEPVEKKPPDMELHATDEDRGYIARSSASSSDISDDGSRNWTTIEIILSVSLLVFALLIFGLQTVIIMKLNVNWTPISILRFNGLTLIITGGLLLVIAGYSNQQMSPVIGLLGAIAGYLLGTSEKSGTTT